MAQCTHKKCGHIVISTCGWRWTKIHFIAFQHVCFLYFTIDLLALFSSSREVFLQRWTWMSNECLCACVQYFMLLLFIFFLWVFNCASSHNYRKRYFNLYTRGFFVFVLKSGCITCSLFIRPGNLLLSTRAQQRICEQGIGLTRI